MEQLFPCGRVVFLSSQHHLTKLLRYQRISALDTEHCFNLIQEVRAEQSITGAGVAAVL
jgi:hypothetical protein